MVIASKFSYPPNPAGLFFTRCWKFTLTSRPIAEFSLGLFQFLPRPSFQRENGLPEEDSGGKLKGILFPRDPGNCGNSFS